MALSDTVREARANNERMESCPRFGHKKCPLAPNNSKRWLCGDYDACLDAFVLRRLRSHNSLPSILSELRVVCNGFDGYGTSDYLLLLRLADVASANDFVFGRKRVERAIRASLIHEDGEVAPYEKREIRKAFGVYGRDGNIRRKSPPTGLTERAKQALCASNSTEGIAEHTLRPQRAHSETFSSTVGRIDEEIATSDGFADRGVVS